MAEGGSLRTCLGTGPGVGKTFAMLAEGRRRADNGERVVAGWLETHGRNDISRLAGGLQVVAPPTVATGGLTFLTSTPRRRSPPARCGAGGRARACHGRPYPAAMAGRRGRPARRAERRHHRQRRAPAVGPRLRSTDQRRGGRSRVFPASLCARGRSSWWTCPPERCARGSPQEWFPHRPRRSIAARLSWQAPRMRSCRCPQRSRPPR